MAPTEKALRHCLLGGPGTRLGVQSHPSPRASQHHRHRGESFDFDIDFRRQAMLKGNR